MITLEENADLENILIENIQKKMCSKEKLFAEANSWRQKLETLKTLIIFFDRKLLTIESRLNDPHQQCFHRYLIYLEEKKNEVKRLKEKTEKMTDIIQQRHLKDQPA